MKQRIVITVYRGMIQEIYASTGLEVLEIDYDIEGHDGELRWIDGSDGREPAIVYTWDVLPDRKMVKKFFNVIRESPKTAQNSNEAAIREDEYGRRI